MKRFPDTIALRFALTTAASMIVANILGGAAVYLTSDHDSKVEWTMPFRIAAFTEAIAATPPEQRTALARRLDRRELEVEYAEEPIPGLIPEPGLRISFVRERIGEAMGKSQAEVIIGRVNGEGAILAEIATGDGNWVRIRPTSVLDPARIRIRNALGIFGLSLIVLSFAFISARRLSAPIGAFGDAAERLGVDPMAPPLPLAGPRELHRAAAAFNRMQERLRRFVEDRTLMLAAMSHDLRTPLARLRLRAELIDEPGQREKLQDDIAQMSAMVEATLSFASDRARSEETCLVDLGAMIGDVCEDAADAGQGVTCETPRGVDLRCRPMAIRRSIVNLVDNAVKYGGVAHVVLTHEADRIRIAVEDAGPGIAPEYRERVFAPFFRLEGSRNRETGGVGLGLAVARTIAREHGGDVFLEDRSGGGLRAVLELPV